MAQTLVSARGIAFASGATGIAVALFDCQYAHEVTIFAQPTSTTSFILKLQVSMDGGTTFTDLGADITDDTVQKREVPGLCKLRLNLTANTGTVFPQGGIRIDSRITASGDLS